MWWLWLFDALRRAGTLRWILRPYRAWWGGFGAILDWFLGFLRA